MNHYQLWEKALQKTEIIRPRMLPLSSERNTQLSYIFLARSSLTPQTTVIRQGYVDVGKPSIILPPSLPHLEGFEFQDMEQTAINFLLIRGIKFPSLKYLNQIKHLDIYDGDLDQARAFYLNRLQREENIQTSFILGSEDSWQYSVLIFVCMMASRVAEKDITALMDEFNQDK